ncbi:tRNA (guanosine(37)-N1)-methyltransferase TrmD [Myxococcus sp. SDU36]|uniref:tRNA (guanosine(37)-N1)-methyltransferase TrmD n=1 Tax=Myxococcus sp. SDU36 TaxID=2831967 RepID=UPI002543D932|nr:tRNA (guanosine(37)-N1)-methyltransferase TrmD [Myxococcus sp. SDU36]WIG97121.1 tRNA (guanosine(37)-N1)-methyltransferase TrmD [Myxococcus sp. SDU36]
MSPPYPVEILTLFPGMVSGYLGASILGKAQEKGLLVTTITDIREYAEGRHRVTDDAPYGGGAGMVMKPEPLVAAIEAARTRHPGARVLLMSPRGPTFTQATARELVRHEAGLILVCGRYEGVDERVMAHLDGELSMGDFVLTGGELAAMTVVDAVARLVPGVLGNVDSSVTESFEEGLLEHPHYTRPPVFRGVEVPAALQSGDHARIARWRRWKSLVLTQTRRPDLYAGVELSKADQKLLARREEEL